MKNSIRIKRYHFTVLILILVSVSVFAQTADDSVSSKKVKKLTVKPEHSPKKASIFSACLPGLGQAYNRKYWKIPLVYAGLGGFGYLTWFNNGLYHDYKDEYIFRTANPGQQINFTDYSDSQVKEQVDFYRRYRDLSVILVAAFYTLNIVDANVDAHLFTFDVSNDLSLNISPSIPYSSTITAGSFGLSLTLKF